MKYDLENRTKKFSIDVITMLKAIKRDRINDNLINQLIRATTSVGANYREANGASSKRDFQNKIFICRKEVQETKYWLELLAEANQENKNTMAPLWKEAHELTLIFNKISTSLKTNKIK